MSHSVFILPGVWGEPATGEGSPATTEGRPQAARSRPQEVAEQQQEGQAGMGEREERTQGESCEGKGALTNWKCEISQSLRL